MWSRDRCSRSYLAAVTVVLLSAVLLDSTADAAGAEERAAAGTGPYAAWPNGPDADEGFFPLAVWCQAPRNAPKYQAIGVNLYVALWKGPTEEQLDELKRHGMPVICAQNEYALQHLDERILVGWMHGDEPDNAQSLGQGKGYGPPILPEKIVAGYRKIRANDPSRPVMLNLGQGVAWDGWHGRGVRTNHPEDYPQYVEGCDIASFDIYPAVHRRPAVAGKLWYVPRGVDRLRKWAGPQRFVWSCIECTHINNPDTKPAPRQVKAEVWMAIIHGSQGIIYFCHQFQPRFVEAGLLADREMAEAVGAINRQIHELASVIHSPTVADAVTVTCRPAAVSAELGEVLDTGPVAAVVKRHGKTTYLFCVRMEDQPARAAFRVAGVGRQATARVVGEDREIAVENGAFTDEFGPHAVHLYAID